MPARSKFSCLSLILTSFSWNMAQAETKKINMASVASSDSSPTSHFCELVYTEAFRRLGYEFALVPKPARRASIEAEAGIVDGEPSRRFEHNKDFPNLIRVDEPIYTLNISGFSANPKIHVDGWASLKGKDFRVDFLRGILLIPQNLAGIVRPGNLLELNERDQAIKRLLKDRSDLYIDGEADILNLLKDLDPAKSKKIFKAGVLARIPAYPFLHKKHAALVALLAETMRQMKREGLFEKYQQQSSVNGF